MTIYEKQNLGKVKQGDIFLNIPYFSYEIIQSAIPKNDIKEINPERDLIIKDLVHKGGSQYIKGFISTTLSLLITQDCDIHNKSSLIFLPLKEIEEEETYNEVNKHLRENTDQTYLPKMKIWDRLIGPFLIKFDQPIYLNRELIWPYLKENRVARVPDHTKSLIIAKFNQYFARPPIDDYIYYDLDQMNEYIKDKIIKEYANTDPSKFEEEKDALIQNLEKNRREEIIEYLIWEDMERKLDELKQELKKFQNSIEDEYPAEDNYNRIKKDVKKFLDLIEEYNNQNYINKREILEKIRNYCKNEESFFFGILKDKNQFEQKFQLSIEEKEAYQEENEFSKLRLIFSRENILNKIKNL